MTVYFITGIDTEIGKTMVTGLVARYFLRQGKSVLTQKLVQTGQIGSISEDILEHRRLLGIDLQSEDLPQSLSDGTNVLTCPYSFAYPASPHLAAHLENRMIMPDNLTNAAKILQQRFDVLLIEGAGGFLVPLTSSLLTADYIEQQRYPIILVTSGRLGSINHTLLTIEAIRRRNLTITGLVVNQHPLQEETISNDSLHYFRQICPNIVVLPSFDASDHIADIDFLPLFHNVNTNGINNSQCH
jgi:dethiobiotin synthetase